MRFLPGAFVILFTGFAFAAQTAANGDFLAPVAVAPIGDRQLAVLGSTSKRLLIVDRATGSVLHTIPLPAEASGMAIHQRNVCVTTSEPAGRLLEINLDGNGIRRTWRVLRSL